MNVAVCYFGDSFVNGTRDPEMLGWTGRLSRLSSEITGGPITHYNLGIRGDTLVSISSRVVKELPLRLHSSLSMRVVVSAGTNDTFVVDGYRRENLESSLSSLSRTIEFSAKLAPVLVVGPPAVPDQSQTKLNAELVVGTKNVCRHFDVPFVDIIGVTATSSIWLSQCSEDDGFHPRAEAYDVVAQHVFCDPEWHSFIA